MRRTVIRTGVCLLLCAIALGAGCWQARHEEKAPEPTPSLSVGTQPSGPEPLETKGRSPREVTADIKLVSSSVIVMRHNVANVDPVLLAETALGMGENKRTIVINRFAPGNLVDVGWKLDYKKASGGKTQDIQITGSAKDEHLLDAYKLYPPALWPEGDVGSTGSGLIWISQDVYENLTRGAMSSFYFGVTDEEYLRVLDPKPGSRLKPAMQRLAKEALRVIDVEHKDVYLAKVTADTVNKNIIVNGEAVTVETMKVTSWFGDMYVLKNPYYPLVLEVRMSEPVRKAFGSLFDFEVTELKDVQG